MYFQLTLALAAIAGTTYAELLPEGSFVRELAPQEDSNGNGYQQSFSGQIDQLGQALEFLQGQLDSLPTDEGLQDLQTQIDALPTDADVAAQIAAALAESDDSSCLPVLDFYTINAEFIGPDSDVLLFDLCVPAGSTVEISASLTGKVDGNPTTFAPSFDLFLDNQFTALAGGAGLPSQAANIGFFYRGTFEEETLVQLESQTNDARIFAKQLQYGIRIWDDCYPAIVDQIPSDYACEA